MIDTAEPRPFVNAALLPRYASKTVRLVGKTSSGGGAASSGADAVLLPPLGGGSASSAAAGTGTASFPEIFARKTASGEELPLGDTSSPASASYVAAVPHETQPEIVISTESESLAPQEMDYVGGLVVPAALGETMMSPQQGLRRKTRNYMIVGTSCRYSSARTRGLLWTSRPRGGVDRSTSAPFYTSARTSYLL